MKIKNILIIFAMFILLMSVAVAESDNLVAHYKQQQNGNNEYSYNGYYNNMTCSVVTYTSNVPTILESSLTYSAYYPQYRYCYASLTTDQMNKHVLRSNTDFSFSFWLNDTLVNPTGYYAYRVFGMYDNNNATGVYFAFDGSGYYAVTVINDKGTTGLGYYAQDEMSANEWYLVGVSYDYDTNDLTMTLNDQEITNSYTISAGTNSKLNNNFWVGSGSSQSASFVNFKTTDVKMYDVTLTLEELQSIYTYGNVTVVPSHEYGFEISQEPINITTQSIGQVTINVTVNDTLGLVDKGTLYEYYNVTAEANYGCGIINANNNTCEEQYYMYGTGFSNAVVTKSRTLDENKYLPRYEPFDYNEMLSETLSTFQLQNSEIIRFTIFNMTTNQSDNVYLEYNAYPVSTLGSYSLITAYCNESYVNGLPVIDDNVNCVLLDEILPSTYNNSPYHCHDIDSCHLLTRLTSQVEWTKKGYFFVGTFGQNLNDRWNIRYLTNSTYNEQSFQYSANDGLSYTNTSEIFDMHVHQFKETDNFNYYFSFTDSESTVTNSTLQIDYFDFINNAPSSVNIYSPPTDSVYTINSTGVDIVFNWSESVDPENDPITYKVAISNNGFIPSINLSDELNSSTFEYTHTFSTSEYSNGDYRAFVLISDPTHTTIAPQTGIFSLCVNNWVATEGVCIDGLTNVTYVDINSCSEQYEQPNSYVTDCMSSTQTNNLFLILGFGMFFVFLILMFVTKFNAFGIIAGMFLLLFSFFMRDFIPSGDVQTLIFIFSIVLSIFTIILSTRYGK